MEFYHKVLIMCWILGISQSKITPIVTCSAEMQNKITVSPVCKGKGDNPIIKGVNIFRFMQIRGMGAGHFV